MYIFCTVKKKKKNYQVCIFYLLLNYHKLKLIYKPYTFILEPTLYPHTIRTYLICFSHSINGSLYIKIWLYILEMKSRLGDHHIWGPEHKKQTPALEHIYLDQQLKTFQTDCKKSCVNFFLHFHMFSSISFWHVTDLCLGQFEGHNIINVQPLLFLLIFISLSFYSLFVPGEGKRVHSALW